MPWGVILMVTGVTVLIALLEKTEGLDLFTSGIARLSTPSTIAPIVAFGTGVEIEPLPIAWFMSVGSSLVDLSSLSTVGALFMAGAAAGTDTRRLFNRLLIWEFSMALVGAALCWVLFG